METTKAVGAGLDSTVGIGVANIADIVGISVGSVEGIAPPDSATNFEAITRIAGTVMFCPKMAS